MSKLKPFLIKFKNFILKSVLWFFILSITSVIIFRWVPIPITPLMIKRCIEQKMEGRDLKLKKDWVSLEDISPKLQLAVVCSEDQRYLEHNGFDFEAMKKAWKSNAKKKKIRGGSTISQQTAKNVFLWDGRNYLRKGFEAYFTVLIEIFWSKERIMEVYLNVIEMGDGVYGSEAAAKEFFQTDALHLNKNQAALIAATLPNPRKFSAKNPSAYVQGRKNWVLKQMQFWGMKLDYDLDNEEAKTPK
jgi:monofunctional glycosyltransferase